MSVAALPMYDLVELRQANDAWWAAIARRLRAAGLGDVPTVLDRERPLEDVWRDDRLFLAQTCGYPLVTTLAERVVVVGTPSYRAPHCDAGTYRSAVIAAENRVEAGLEGLRGRRLSSNAADSHSGTNALRAMVAPLADGGRFFSEVKYTGSHRASIAAVRSGEADAAAVDVVTLALIRDVASAELDGLNIVALSDPAPCLPYITAPGRTVRELTSLRDALAAAVRDPALERVRRALRIDGFEAADASAYAPIADAEALARALDYPVLG